MTKKEMMQTLQRAEAKAWKEYCEFKAAFATVAPDGVQQRRVRWMAVDTLLNEMSVPRFTPRELFEEGLVPDPVR
jgi:hypothetical protein